MICRTDGVMGIAYAAPREGNGAKKKRRYTTAPPLPPQQNLAMNYTDDAVHENKQTKKKEGEQKKFP